MVAKATVGHEFLSCYEKPSFARMIVVGYGYWSGTQSAGAPGFDGFPALNTQFQALSRSTLEAMMTWVCGGAGAKNVLITSSDPQTSGQWSPEFTNALTAAGHTFTLTGDISKFGAYDPLDFDMMFCEDLFSVAETYNGMTVSWDKFDFLLGENLPLIVDLRMTGAGEFERYGFNKIPAFHTAHGSTYGAPEWKYQRPFHCAPMGAAQYGLVKYTTTIFEAGTNIMGGTSAVYNCEADVADNEGVIGLWDGNG